MADILGRGGPAETIGAAELEKLMRACAAQVPAGARRILLIPPDFSRFHSGAGEICAILYRELCGSFQVDLLPALGTHRPMTVEEMATMFPGVPPARIHVHDWRGGIRQCQA